MTDFSFQVALIWAQANAADLHAHEFAEAVAAVVAETDRQLYAEDKRNLQATTDTGFA